MGFGTWLRGSGSHSCFLLARFLVPQESAQGLGKTTQHQLPVTYGCSEPQCSQAEACAEGSEADGQSQQRTPG